MIEYIWVGVLGLIGASIRNLRNSIVHKGTEREPTASYWVFMLLTGYFLGSLSYYMFSSYMGSPAIVILVGYVLTDLVSAIYAIITGKFMFSGKTMSKRKKRL